MSGQKTYPYDDINKPEIVGQTVGFLFYTLLGLLRTYSDKGLTWQMVVGITFFFAIEFLYLNLVANWLMARYSSYRQPVPFYLILLSLFGSYLLLRYYTAYPNYIDILNSYDGENASPPLSFFFFQQLNNFSLTFMIGAALRLYKDVIYADRRARSLEEEVSVAKMQMLKYQINPHFLYNTLSYIYAQARPLSENLSKSVLLLSKMMRYALNQTEEQGDTLLSKEIEYMQNFIEMHQLRFGESLHVNFSIEGIVNSRRIVPLVLITFVENAFKHGKLNDPQCPITIRLMVSKTATQFVVENYKQPGLKDKTSGVGLINTRKRLELAYPDKHTLQIIDTIDFFAIHLSIDLAAQIARTAS